MSQPFSMTLDTVVSRTSGLASANIDEDVAVLYLERGLYYTLNPTGALVWERLSEPRRVSELRDALLAEFETTPEECERDLFSLLADLGKEDLIQIQGG